MNKTKRHKRLFTLAAICSSVFLLAACEPGTSDMGETDDPSSPTFGDPGRDDTGAPDMEPSTTPPPPQDTAPSTEPGTGTGTETP